MRTELIQMAKIWRQSPKWIKWGWLLGGMACLSARMIRRRPAILVIFSGSLGDGLLFTGALRQIRLEKQAHKIILLTSFRAYPVLERCPYADVVLAPPMGAGFSRQMMRMMQAIRVFSRSYELVLCPNAVQGEPDVNMAELVSAQRRVLMEWGTTLLFSEGGRGVAPSGESTSKLHEIDRILFFLSVAGFNDARTREDIWPELYATDSERAKAIVDVDTIRSRVPGVLVIALCPGVRFKQKDWGKSNYIELIHRLAQTRPVGVLLLGGLDDKPVMDDIVAGICSIDGIMWLNKTGQCGIQAAAAMIEQADLCIGNDTFGLHAAIVVKTPSVVMMWGGDNERWAPWGDPRRHGMVRSCDQSCFGCQGKCLWPEFRCMTSITVDDALGAVLDLLEVVGDRPFH